MRYNRSIKYVFVFLFFCITFSVNAQTYPNDPAYYNSINPINANFISALKDRIRDPYVKKSYDDFNTTSFYYVSYNVGGGQFGIRCVYSWYEHRFIPPQDYQIINREHTWCQDWMPIGANSSLPQYSDQHHIFPTHKSANSSRGNDPLGNVVVITGSFGEGKRGWNASTYPGYYVYEPRNQHKGDAARALLYMCIRYDDVVINGTSYYWDFNLLSTKNQDLNTLLNWHRQDPPDKFEVDRNTYIETIQRNRNPFIDHPEYANYVNFYTIDKFPSDPIYSTEPSNHLTNLTAAVNGATIELNWTGATGANLPTGYLVEVYNINSYYIPIDGYELPVNTSLDSFKVKYVPHVIGNNTCSFSGLTENTRYYFKVFPYADDGTVAKRNYKIDGTVPSVNEVAGSSALVANPLSFTATGSGLSQIDLSATANANGNNIVVVYNSSGTFTVPTDGVPPGNIGASLAGGTILYKGGAGLLTNHTGLSSGLTVYYKAFSFDGSNNYSTGLARNAVTLKTVPTLQASNITFSSVTSVGMTINWTNGNGQNRVVYMNTTNIFLPPSDGSNPIANNTYTFGQQCIYNSNGTNVSVTGLSDETTYWFRVYEYNNSGVNTIYLNSISSNNPNSNVTNPTIVFKEDFETGSKTAYAIGVSTCTMGIWTFDNALYTSSDAGDKKNGTKSARIRSPGSIYMNFDATKGARTITIYHASYSTDAGVTWKLQKSIDGGLNWTDVGSQITSTATLVAETFNIYQSGNIRFKVINTTSTSGRRLNIDDITITDYDKSISGSTQLNYSEYGNLTINGSGINVTLSGNTTVNGTLTLTNGNINIGSNNLIFSQNATISGTPSEYNMIVADGTGQVIKYFNSTGSFTFPVGDNTGLEEYSPVTLNFTSGTFGTGAYVSVNLKNEVHPANSTSPLRINRYWTVAQNNITVFNCNASFTMLEADLSGTGNQGDLYCWKRDGTTWTKGKQISGNELSFNSISSFSDFTGSGNDEPMPVSLSTFVSSVVSRDVKLNWVTESEENNSGFFVERGNREQGIGNSEYSFVNLGFVEGKGTKNTPTSYSFEDKNLNTGKYKYRLKQVDHNGNFEYFELNGEVEVGVPKKFDLSQNYPNPFNPVTKINFDLPVDSRVSILVYDVAGREVARVVNNEFKKAGYYTSEFKVGNLSSGVYFYVLSAENFRAAKKMVVLR